MSMQIHILMQKIKATESERADRLNKESTDCVGNVPTAEPPSPAIILQEIIIYKTREAARVTKSCKSG